MSSRAFETAEGPAPSTRTLFFSLFPSLMLPMFLASLDQTIVATALPTIAGTLGEVERVSWVVVSYLIATTIAAPVYGRLGDVVGRKRMLLAALVIFVATSVLCGLSRSVSMLTFARLLQGFGGGGLMTLSQALIGEALPPRERGRFQGYLAAVYMSASTFGPVVGGYLTQHYGWPSVFLINLPLGAVAFLMALRLPKREAGGGRLAFDIPGVLLFAAVIAPTLLALEQIQRVDAQAVPRIVGLSLLAAVALWLLLLQERRTRTPLLSLTLLQQPVIWRSIGLGCCVGATLLSLITFLPIYLQVVRGTDPTDTGYLMLPLTACVAVGSLCTGQLIARTARTAIFPSCGFIAVSLLLLTLAVVAPRLHTAQLPWIYGLISLCMGTAMPVVNITVQLAAGRAQLGAAAAMVQFSRSVGSALGTAIVAAVLFADLSVADRSTAPLFAELVERGPVVLQGLSPARQVLVQGEIADAFRAAFAAIAVFAAAGAAMAWSIPMRRI